MSWSARAGWCAGMFSAPKFIQSDSTSGPSAIAQPMAPKMAAISSMVRLIGWIRPVSRGRGGRVGSSVSFARRASSSAFSSSARRASIRVVRVSLSRFSAAPRSRRCSGGVLPRSRSSPVRRPFRPSVATRTASQARRSGAAARAASVSRSRSERSSVMGSIHTRHARASGHPGGRRRISRPGSLLVREVPCQTSAVCTFFTISANDAASS